MAIKRKKQEKQKELEQVLCGDCIYWERLAIQEENMLVDGVCHESPILPQRKATDWCSRAKRVI